MLYFRKKIEILDEQLEKLLTQLTAYSHEQLNTKAAPGSWSVMQTIQHLMVAEKTSIDYSL